MANRSASHRELVERLAETLCERDLGEGSWRGVAFADGEVARGYRSRAEAMCRQTWEAMQTVAQQRGRTNFEGTNGRTWVPWSALMRLVTGETVPEPTPSKETAG